MTDRDFGNRVYTLRKNAGLSQNELGKRLGVSGKAVSKWENGNAKPHLDMIMKLAALFEVSTDELLKKDKSGEKHITKIVITGGPCAGKTTALSRIQTAFTDLGYAVVFIPETATELITGGIAPWTLESNLDYQFCQMKLQLAKEKIFAEGAEKLFGKDKVLVVCDRGMMDNKAYMTENEFANALQLLDCSETELRDEYDAVFHLVTAAKGAKEFYTTVNNGARTETAEEAVHADDRLISAWTGHPHFRVIDNSTGFEDKMNRLITEISSFLGEPEPLEIERKFLIALPDAALLGEKSVKRLAISQVYLRAGTSGAGRRIRRARCGDETRYYYTEKTRVTAVTRIEREHEITAAEFEALLSERDEALRTIEKTRYLVPFERHTLEIDVFPFCNDRAFCECELQSQDESRPIPDWLHVYREVTDDPRYTNRALARSVPDEIL